MWLEGDKLFHRWGAGLLVVLLLVLQLVGTAIFERGYGRTRLLLWLTVATLFAIAVLLETAIAYVVIGVIPSAIKRMRNADQAQVNTSSGIFL